MFRVTEDPSSGSLVQCLAKNCKNGSIVSVDMDKVGVMAAFAARSIVAGDINSPQKLCCATRYSVLSYCHISTATMVTRTRQRVLLILLNDSLMFKLCDIEVVQRVNEE